MALNNGQSISDDVVAKELRKEENDDERNLVVATALKVYTPENESFHAVCIDPEPQLTVKRMK